MYKVLQGDAREKLLEIPEKSVQCVITSPPYWGLRDYGLAPTVWGGDPDCEHEWVEHFQPPKGGKSHPDRPSIVGANRHMSALDIRGVGTYSGFCQKCGAWLGCLGLEPTPELYVKHMVEIFRGVWRVLRDDGTVWLNLGDTYNAGRDGGHPGGKAQWKPGQQKYVGRSGVNAPGLKPKDLVGIPWRVAFALQADGWYLRSGMPWVKRSAMPESVRDRPASALEYFFLLSKSRKYFYDVEAVRMPGAIPAGTKAAKGSKERAKQPGVNARPAEYKVYSGTRNRRNTDWFMESIEDILNGESGTLLHDEGGLPIAIFCNPQPYKKAHFATFSPRLITPMVLAGTSPRACEVCGAPWKRVATKRAGTSKECPKTQAAHEARGGVGRPTGTVGKSGGGRIDGYSFTTGWQPTCTCDNEGRGRCIVLDPFAGSGTTLGVAEALGRDSIGIEVSEQYCGYIPERVADLSG